MAWTANVRRCVFLVIVVCVPGTFAWNGDSQQSLSPDPEWLERLVRWSDAVIAHEPGRVDAPLRDLATWSADDVSGTVEAFLKLVPAWRDSRPGGPVLVGKRIIKADAVRRIRVLTDGAPETVNRTLRRAAALHADVALHAPLDASTLTGRAASSVRRPRSWRTSSSALAVLLGGPPRSREVGSTFGWCSLNTERMPKHGSAKRWLWTPVIWRRGSDWAGGWFSGIEWIRPSRTSGSSQSHRPNRHWRMWRGFCLATCKNVRVRRRRHGSPIRLRRRCIRPHDRHGSPSPPWTGGSAVRPMLGGWSSRQSHHQSRNRIARTPGGPSISGSPCPRRIVSPDCTR